MPLLRAKVAALKAEWEAALASIRGQWLTASAPEMAVLARRILDIDRVLEHIDHEELARAEGAWRYLTRAQKQGRA
jgi:hypothetical protein